MCSGANHLKQKKYAYCLLHSEEEEAEKFAELLYDKYKQTECWKNFGCFWKWNEQIGKNKFKLLKDVIDQSIVTIVLYSPKFLSNQWKTHEEESAIMKTLGRKCIFPISICGAPISENMINLTSLAFKAESWLEDDKSWRCLLKAIHEKVCEHDCVSSTKTCDKQEAIKGKGMCAIQIYFVVMIHLCYYCIQ